MNLAKPPRNIATYVLLACGSVSLYILFVLFILPALPVDSYHLSNDFDIPMRILLAVLGMGVFVTLRYRLRVKLSLRLDMIIISIIIGAYVGARLITALTQETFITLGTCSTPRSLTNPFGLHSAYPESCNPNSGLIPVIGWESIPQYTPWFYILTDIFLATFVFYLVFLSLRDFKEKWGRSSNGDAFLPKPR